MHYNITFWQVFRLDREARARSVSSHHQVRGHPQEPRVEAGLRPACPRLPCSAPCRPKTRSSAYWTARARPWRPTRMMIPMHSNQSPRYVAFVRYQFWFILRSDRVKDAERKTKINRKHHPLNIFSYKLYSGSTIQTSLLRDFEFKLSEVLTCLL